MNANAFASTFLFFATHNANAEKNKKEIASQRTRQRKHSCGLDTTRLRTKEKNERTTLDLRKFFIWGFYRSYESSSVIKHLCFVESVVLKLPQTKNFANPCPLCPML